MMKINGRNAHPKLSHLTAAADIKVGFAPWACEHDRPPRKASLLLEDTFMTILVAASTKIMLWFGALHAWLYAIGRDPGPADLHKFIALFFCIPCFKISNLFFKIAYALNERHLRRLGLQNLAIEREYRLITNSSIADIRQALSRVEKLRKYLQAGNCLDDHCAPLK